MSPPLTGCRLLSAAGRLPGLRRQTFTDRRLDEAEQARLTRANRPIRLSVLVALECLLPASRPYWKGYLKLSFVSCPVALYPATSAAERVSFRQVNRRTGHRLKHKLVDSVTGEAVNASDKARGYEIGENGFLFVEDRDLAQARNERPPPGSIPLAEPPHRESPPTVRSETDYFSVPEMKLPSEMMKLAQHTITTKSEDFDPSMLEDHYRNALVRILRRKQAKRPAHPAPVKPSAENVVNLMDALRRSIAAERPAARSAYRRSAARTPAKRTAGARKT